MGLRSSQSAVGPHPAGKPGRQDQRGLLRCNGVACWGKHNRAALAALDRLAAGGNYVLLLLAQGEVLE